MLHLIPMKDPEEKEGRSINLRGIPLDVHVGFKTACVKENTTIRNALLAFMYFTGTGKISLRDILDPPKKKREEVAKAGGKK